MKRQEFILSSGWKFYLGDAPGAWQKSFNDDTWQSVSVPHDWSVSKPFDIKYSSGTGYLPSGLGYYRKTFHLPAELKGKRISVIFDGVYNNSMVWCNSYYLGKRPYGYSQFVYDISDSACFGDTPNVLTVKVDHRNFGDSRWFTGSGIYRKVTVIAAEKTGIGYNGVFVTTKSLKDGEAILSIQSDTSENSTAIIKNTLYGNDGQPAAETTDASDCLTVKNPCLWSVDSPYLYELKTTLLNPNGEVLDEVTTKVGIRLFEFDADKGFFLNGVNMKLKGVCVHHDAGCLGAAVREKVWERRLKKLKEMGCNAIRMSHNPHMPELYDLCDRMGFLVIDEAFDEWEGVKNKWTTGHNVYPPVHNGYYEDFPDWHEADLSAMVLRDRNHPSVILWSIGNEIDYPNDPYNHHLFKSMTGNNDANKPLEEMIFDPGKPSADRLPVIARKLVSIVKRYDTTRPVTAALAYPELSNITGLADCLDVVGYNYKEKLYTDDHKKYLGRVLLGSENGRGLKEWLAVLNNDFISGQFIWTGIDYLGETPGWPSHGSASGFLDTAGFEKPSYYFRKSLWNEKPSVKLFTAINREKQGINDKDVRPHWCYENNQSITVYCFTNCEEAELFINGISRGIKKAADCGDGYITWVLPYESGELKAVAKQGNIVCEDILRTTQAAVYIKLEASESVITANGRDMTHVTVYITDANGEITANADNLIKLEVSGAGTLLGLDNGDLSDTTCYANNNRRVRNGKLIAYISSTEAAGEITVTAYSDSLSDARLIIKTI